MSALGVLFGALGGWQIWQARVAADATNYVRAMKAAGSLEAHHQYDSALKVWDGYLIGWPPHNYRYQAFGAQGALLEVTGDFKGALVKYRQAEALKPGQRPELESIARVSEALHDTPTAIDYYQRTLDTLPHSGINYPGDKQWLTQKIAQLKTESSS